MRNGYCIAVPSRIEDDAMGDLRTAALVSTTGPVDRLCLPTFDSTACCASPPT